MKKITFLIFALFCITLIRAQVAPEFKSASPENNATIAKNSFANFAFEVTFDSVLSSNFTTTAVGKITANGTTLDITQISFKPNDSATVLITVKRTDWQSSNTLELTIAAGAFESKSDGLATSAETKLNYSYDGSVTLGKFPYNGSFNQYSSKTNFPAWLEIDNPTEGFDAAYTSENDCGTANTGGFLFGDGSTVSMRMAKANVVQIKVTADAPRLVKLWNSETADTLIKYFDNTCETGTIDYAVNTTNPVNVYLKTIAGDAAEYGGTGTVTSGTALLYELNISHPVSSMKLDSLRVVSVTDNSITIKYKKDPAFTSYTAYIGTTLAGTSSGNINSTVISSTADSIVINYLRIGNMMTGYKNVALTPETKYYICVEGVYMGPEAEYPAMGIKSDVVYDSATTAEGIVLTEVLPNIFATPKPLIDPAEGDMLFRFGYNQLDSIDTVAVKHDICLLTKDGASATDYDFSVSSGGGIFPTIITYYKKVADQTATVNYNTVILNHKSLTPETEYFVYIPVKRYFNKQSGIGNIGWLKNMDAAMVSVTTGKNIPLATIAKVEIDSQGVIRPLTAQTVAVPNAQPEIKNIDPDTVKLIITFTEPVNYRTNSNSVKFRTSKNYAGGNLAGAGQMLHKRVVVSEDKKTYTFYIPVFVAASNHNNKRAYGASVGVDLTVTGFFDTTTYGVGHDYLSTYSGRQVSGNKVYGFQTMPKYVDEITYFTDFAVTTSTPTFVKLADSATVKGEAVSFTVKNNQPDTIDGLIFTTTDAAGREIKVHDYNLQRGTTISYGSITLDGASSGFSLPELQGPFRLTYYISNDGSTTSSVALRDGTTQLKSDDVKSINGKQCIYNYTGTDKKVLNLFTSTGDVDIHEIEVFQTVGKGTDRNTPDVASKAPQAIWFNPTKKDGLNRQGTVDIRFDQRIAIEDISKIQIGFRDAIRQDTIIDGPDTLITNKPDTVFVKSVEVFGNALLVHFNTNMFKDTLTIKVLAGAVKQESTNALNAASSAYTFSTRDLMYTGKEMLTYSINDTVFAKDGNAFGFDFAYDSTLNLSDLVAEFTVSEAAIVTVNGVEQESGVTSNDFTNPVTYVVKAFDTDSTAQYIVTVTMQEPPVSINPIITTEVISIYPNPTSDVINIKGLDMQQVNVYDISGRLVKTLNTAGNNTATISMSGLLSGQYIVSIVTKTGIRTAKVVKQ